MKQIYRMSLSVHLKTQKKKKTKKKMKYKNFKRLVWGQNKEQNLSKKWWCNILIFGIPVETKIWKGRRKH